MNIATLLPALQLAIKQHFDCYLLERRTNHVKEEWEKARAAEAEEYKRRYDEWVRQEVSFTKPLSYQIVSIFCSLLVARFLHTVLPCQDSPTRGLYRI